MITCKRNIKGKRRLIEDEFWRTRDGALLLVIFVLMDRVEAFSPAHFVFE